eukprot:767057-Hanusia_phi.AAC.2
MPTYSPALTFLPPSLPLRFSPSQCVRRLASCGWKRDTNSDRGVSGKAGERTGEGERGRERRGREREGEERRGEGEEREGEGGRGEERRGEEREGEERRGRGAYMFIF